MTAGSHPTPTSPLGQRMAALWLLILCVAAALLIPRHEPWFDEAQAWLLARDAPLPDIFWKYARYEACPSLWHALLSIPAKAGAPAATLNYVSAGLAMVAAGLLIFRSPFPLYLRALLPAGFFFFYQYGIVARTYALVMPMAWLVAILYPERFTRPWRYIGALIVFTHVSLHSAWIAGGLMLAYIVEAWFVERWTPRRLMPYVLAFGADTAVILAQLWPPHDLYGPAWVASESRVWLVLREMWLNSLTPWPALSGAVLLIALAFFYSRGVLLSYVVTTGGLLAIFAFRFYSIWHEGLLYLLLILHGWMAWNHSKRRALGRIRPEVANRIFAGALSLTAAVQVWWSAFAYYHDWIYPYSGSREAAAYLQDHGIDKQRIHVFKFSTCALLLYLDHNPFANVAPYMPGAFWVWNQAIFAGQNPRAILTGNPPWVLVGAQLLPEEIPKTAPALPGYTLERIFPGRFIWKDDFYRTDSYYLYRRVAE